MEGQLGVQFFRSNAQEQQHDQWRRYCIGLWIAEEANSKTGGDERSIHPQKREISNRGHLFQDGLSASHTERK